MLFGGVKCEGGLHGGGGGPNLDNVTLCRARSLGFWLLRQPLPASMAGARAVAVATPAAPARAGGRMSSSAPRRSSLFRVSCRYRPRVTASGPAATRSGAARGRARLSSRDPADAETDADAGRVLKVGASSPAGFSCLVLTLDWLVSSHV